jgi:membrane-associated protease RseP (regulator of RpoE activity)
VQIREPAVSEERFVEELRAQVEDVLLASDVSLSQEGKAVLFTGRLLWDAETAFSLLHERLKAKGLLPFLQRRKGQDSVLIVPAPQERGKPRPIINLLLFVATIFTTLFAGASWEGFDPLQNPGTLKFGIPFASALLLILGTHELSHYFVAQRHGFRVSLPYFIPVPIGLGTFGAFIRMESVAKDRKGFFDVGLAGPLAGLAMAIPILILGLFLSEVRPIIHGPGYISEGNSLLYLTLKYIVHGQILPSRGVDIFLHPVAFAGWIGLMITGVNLLPAGQLDGGHVAYALLGRAYKWVAQLILLLLMGLGLFLWSGWLLWALLILLSGPGHPRPLNDISDVGGKRKVVGILALLLFLTIFTPVPFS